jgi:hypothetical protein
MPVGDEVLDRAAINAGATSGFLLAAVNAIIAIAAQFGWFFLPLPAGGDPHALALGHALVFGFVACVDLLWSWRVKTGRGYVSAILLLTLTAVELALLELAVAGRYAGMLLISLLMIKFLYDGVRGSWSARKRRKILRGVDPSAFD